MASTRKKAILRYLSQEWRAGYLAPEDLAGRTTGEPGHSPLLLDLTGSVVPIPMPAIKWICFVREFQSGELNHPERLLQKAFLTRPRHAGVWLRLRVADGDSFEGLAANDLSLLDPAGLFLTPPDTRSNTQRLFVPRTAISALEALSVVRAGSRKEPPRKLPAAAPAQDSLFRRSDLLG